MQPIFACAACGLDPTTEGLLLQVVQAAAISIPLLFRARVASAFGAAHRRLRGMDSAARCPSPPPEHDRVRD